MISRGVEWRSFSVHSHFAEFSLAFFTGMVRSIDCIAWRRFFVAWHGIAWPAWYYHCPILYYFFLLPTSYYRESIQTHHLHLRMRIPVPSSPCPVPPRQHLRIGHPDRLGPLAQVVSSACSGGGLGAFAAVSVGPACLWKPSHAAIVSSTLISSGGRLGAFAAVSACSSSSGNHM
jgi:hypothetical protein